MIGAIWIIISGIARSYESDSHRGVFPISREKLVPRSEGSARRRRHAGHHCAAPVREQCCGPRVPAGCLFANTAHAPPLCTRSSRVDIAICYNFGNTIRGCVSITNFILPWRVPIFTIYDVVEPCYLFILEKYVWFPRIASRDATNKTIIKLEFYYFTLTFFIPLAGF